MKRVISNIKNIPEVIGVSIFNDSGQLVAFDFPEAYEKDLINQFGNKFQSIKEILPDDENDMLYLCWEYSNFLFFYYPVKGGWINIISTESIPMPVFSLTMNAVSNKLPIMLETAQPFQEKPDSIPEETVPKKTIEELKNVFTLFLGPAATVLFNKEAQKLGQSLSGISTLDLKRVLDGMLAKIPDKKKNDAMKKLREFY